MARPRTGAAIYRSTCKRHGGKCWRGVYYDSDGVRREVRAPLHGLSKPDARLIVERLASQAALDQAGVTTRADRITLKEYWAVYIADIEADRAHAESSVKKKHEHGRHILPTLGALRLSELDEAAVQAARRKWRTRARYEGDPNAGQPLSPRTEYAVDKTLTTVVQHAARAGIFGEAARREALAGRWRKPWRSPPRPKATEVEVLETPAEFGAVLAAAHAEGGVMLAAAVVLLAVTGQRRGEQSGLRLSDVRTDARGRMTIRTYQPKTGKTVTAIVSGDARAVVEAWLKERAERWPDSDVLFPRTVSRVEARRYRRRTEAVTVYAAGSERSGYVISDRAWQRIRERAGVPWLHVHGMRHSLARWLDEAGTSERAIQDVFGHASRDTTRRYTFRAPREAAEAVAKVTATLKLPFFEERSEGDGEVAE